jgi:hypothetical protein
MQGPRKVPDRAQDLKLNRRRKRSRRWWLEVDVPQRDLSYYDQIIFSRANASLAPRSQKEVVPPVSQIARIQEQCRRLHLFGAAQALPEIAASIEADDGDGPDALQSLLEAELRFRLAARN